MAFSTSSLAIEQVTFEADDTRCSGQNINSFESLVCFESEFPRKDEQHVRAGARHSSQQTKPSAEKKPLKELKLFGQSPIGAATVAADESESESLTNDILDNLQQNSHIDADAAENNISATTSIETVLGNIDTDADTDHVLSPISTIVNPIDNSPIVREPEIKTSDDIGSDLNDSRANTEHIRASLFNMSQQEFTIPDAKELQRAVLGDRPAPVSAAELPVLDVQNVLKKAQDILSAYNKSRSTSPTPSNREASSRVMQADLTGEAVDSKLDSSQRSTRSSRAPPTNLIQQYLSARSRTISNSSNIFDDNDSVALKAYGANVSELDHLREENEHLSIKLNRLRYDLKSRDSTVDDLKLKITQMYVELEASNMTKRKLESDLDAIKRDFNLHSSLESARLKEQIASVSAEKDALLQRLQPLEMSYAQQIQMIDRLRLEKDELARQAQETNAKLSRERDELSKRLESFEADIVQRERYAFGQKFEKMLFENSEEIRAEETRKFQQLLLAEKERYENEIKVLKSQQTSQQATFESQLNFNRNELISSLAKEVETKFNVLNQERDALYQTEKKALEDKINELNAEIGGLVKSLVDEKQKLTDKTNELTEANKQILKVKADLKKLQKSDTSKSAPNVSSKPSVESKQTDTSDIDWTNYEDKYKAASVDLENLNREIAALREENAKFKESSTTIVSPGENGVQDESQIRDLNDKILEAQALSQTLASNFGEWNKSNESIESLILEQQELHVQYTANLNEWTSATEVIKQSVEKAQNEKLQIEAVLEKAQVDLDEVQKRKTVLDEELTALRAKSSELEAGVLSTQQLNAELEKNLNEWNAANQEVEKRILELQIANQQLVTSLADLNQANKPKNEQAETEAESREEVDKLVVEKLEKDQELERLQKELNEIKEKKQVLEDELTTATAQTTQLETSVLGIQQLNSQLKKNLNDWNLANQAIEKQILELQAANQQLTAQLSNINRVEDDDTKKVTVLLNQSKPESESLRREQLQVDAELEQVRVQLDESKAKKAKLDEELATTSARSVELQASILQTQQLNSELEKNFAEWSGVNKEIERKILELQAANQELTERVSSLSKQGEAERAKIEQLERALQDKSRIDTDLAQKQTELDEAKKKKEEIDGEFAKVTAQTTELEANILSIQQLNGELAKNLNDWALANQQIEKSILELQAANQSLTANLAELNQPKQQDGDRSEAREADQQAELMKTLKQQIDQLNTQNEHLKTENFRLSDQIDAVRLEKDKLEQDFNSLDTAKMQAECDIIALKNEVDGLEQLKNQLNKQIERHVAVEEEMRSRYEELAKQNQELIDSKQAALKAQETEQGRLADEVSQVGKQVDDLNERLRVLEEQKTSVEEEMKKKEAEIIQLQELNKTLGENHVSWQNSNGQLEALITEQQELSKKLNENLVEWQKANYAIEAHIVELQNQNVVLNANLQAAQNGVVQTTAAPSVATEATIPLASSPEAPNLETVNLNIRIKSLEEINNGLLESNESYKKELGEKETLISTLQGQLQNTQSSSDKFVRDLKETIQPFSRTMFPSVHYFESDEQASFAGDLAKLLDDFKRSYESSLESFHLAQRQFDEVSIQLQNLRVDLASNQEARAKLEAEMDAAKKTRGDLESKIAELDEELKKAVSDRDKAVEEVKAHSLDMSHELAMIEEEKLKNQLDEHKAQIGRLEQLRQELQVQNMDLLGEVDTLKIENEDLVMNCELAKKELDDFKALVEQQEEERRSKQAAETESAAQDLERTIEELRLANSKKAELIETLNEEISGLKAARSELESQVEELNNKLSSIESLNSQLDARKEENEELKVTTGRLNRELSELKSQLDLNSTELNSTIEELSNVYKLGREEGKREESLALRSQASVVAAPAAKKEEATTDEEATNELDEKLSRYEKNIQELIFQNQNLENELLILQMDKESQGKDVQEIRAEAEEALKLKANEINDLNQKLDAIHKVKQQLQIENMDMLSEIDSLKIENDELELSIKQLKLDMADLKKNAKRKSPSPGRSGRDALSSGSEKSISELEKSIEEYQLTIKQNQAQLSSFEKEKYELLGQIGELRGQLERSQDEGEKKQATLEELNAKLDEIQELKSRLESDNKDLEQRIDELNRLLVAKENELTEKSAQIDEYKSVIESKDSEISQLTSRVADESGAVNKESYLAEESKQIEKEAQELETAIVQNQELNKTLLANLEGWKASNEAVEKAILDTQALNATLMQNLGDWQASNVSLEAEILRAQSLNGELSTKLAEASASIEQVNSSSIDGFKVQEADENSNLKAEIARLVTDIQKLREELETSEKQKSVNEDLAATQRNLLAKQEDEMRAQSHKYESLLELKNQLIAKLEKKADEDAKLIEAQALNKDLGTNLSEWAASNANLEGLILEQQNLFATFTENLNEWKLANSAIEKQILDLQVSNQQLQESLAKTSSETGLVNGTSQAVAEENAENLGEKLSQASNKSAELQASVLSAQQLNVELEKNLNEWTFANQEIERKILELQAVNQQLTANLAELNQPKLQEDDVEESKKESAEMQKTEPLEEKISKIAEEQAELMKTLKQQIDQLNTQNEHLKTENFRLSDQIDAVRLEKDKLEQDFNSLDTAKMQAECDIIALKNEVDGLEQLKNQLNKQIERHVAAEEEMRSRYEELAKQNQELIDSKQAALKAQEAEQGRLADEVSQVGKQVDDLNERLRVLEEQKTGVEEEMKKKEAEILQLQELNKTLGENHVSWQNSNGQLEALITEQQELSKKLNENLVEWQKANYAIEAHIVELQNQNAVLNANLQAAQNSVAQATMAPSVATEATIPLDSSDEMELLLKLKQVEDTNAELTALNQKLQTELEERQILINDLKNQSAHSAILAKESLVSSQDPFTQNKLIQKTLALKKCLEILRTKIDSMEAKFSGISNQIASCVATSSVTDELQLQSVQSSDADLLKLEINKLKSEKSHLHLQLTKLESDKATLKEVLNSRKDKIKSFRNNFNEIMSEYNAESAQLGHKGPSGGVSSLLNRVDSVEKIMQDLEVENEELEDRVRHLAETEGQLDLNFQKFRVELWNLQNVLFNRTAAVDETSVQEQVDAESNLASLKQAVIRLKEALNAGETKPKEADESQQAVKLAIYENLVRDQRLLIQQLERRYNDQFGRLVQTLDDIELDTTANNVDEMQDDLGSVIKTLNQLQEYEPVEQTLRAKAIYCVSSQLVKNAELVLPAGDDSIPSYDPSETEMSSLNHEIGNALDGYKMEIFGQRMLALDPLVKAGDNSELPAPFESSSSASSVSSNSETSSSICFTQQRSETGSNGPKVAQVEVAKTDSDCQCELIFDESSKYESDIAKLTSANQDLLEQLNGKLEEINNLNALIKYYESNEQLSEKKLIELIELNENLNNEIKLARKLLDDRMAELENARQSMKDAEIQAVLELVKTLLDQETQTVNEAPEARGLDEKIDVQLLNSSAPEPKTFEDRDCQTMELEAAPPKPVLVESGSQTIQKVFKHKKSQAQFETPTAQSSCQTETQNADAHTQTALNAQADQETQVWLEFAEQGLQVLIEDEKPIMVDGQVQAFYQVPTSEADCQVCLKPITSEVETQSQTDVFDQETQAVEIKETADKDLQVLIEDEKPSTSDGESQTLEKELSDSETQVEQRSTTDQDVQVLIEDEKPESLESECQTEEKIIVDGETQTILATSDQDTQAEEEKPEMVEGEAQTVERSMQDQEVQFESHSEDKNLQVYIEDEKSVTSDNECQTDEKTTADSETQMVVEVADQDLQVFIEDEKAATNETESQTDEKMVVDQEVQLEYETAEKDSQADKPDVAENEVQTEQKTLQEQETQAGSTTQDMESQTSQVESTDAESQMETNPQSDNECQTNQTELTHAECQFESSVHDNESQTFVNELNDSESQTFSAELVENEIQATVDVMESDTQVPPTVTSDMEIQTIIDLLEDTASKMEMLDAESQTDIEKAILKRRLSSQEIADTSEMLIQKKLESTIDTILTSSELDQDQTNISNEINSLQDLIESYLSLIKKYKEILTKLDAVNLDHSQLKSSYENLNKKYLKLKVNKPGQKTKVQHALSAPSASTKRERGDEQLEQQVSNLKQAYEELYKLYINLKSHSSEVYNVLHNKFMKLKADETNSEGHHTGSTTSTVTGVKPPSKLTLLRNKIKAERAKNAKLASEAEAIRTELNKLTEELNQKLADHRRSKEETLERIRVMEAEHEAQLIQIDAVLKSEQSKNEKLKAQIVELESKLEDLADAQYHPSRQRFNKLKNDLKMLKEEKAQLEAKITELNKQNESQHIRAKLIAPPNSETSSIDGGSEHYMVNHNLRALMPAEAGSYSDLHRHSSSLRNASSLSLSTSSMTESLNDFAIDITHIEKFVHDSVSDSTVLDQKPLEGVQSCLKSLREQMTELHEHQAYEQIRSSSSWKYKLGYTCEKCEMKWEIEHQVNNDDIETDDFLENPLISKPVPRCNCARLDAENSSRESKTDL